MLSQGPVRPRDVPPEGARAERLRRAWHQRGEDEGQELRAADGLGAAAGREAVPALQGTLLI